MKLNLFQFSFQVIMITEAAKVGSEGGQLDVVGAARRGRGGNRVIPIISGF